MNDTEILHRTRAILTEKTWVRHPPNTRDGEVCLLIALDQAAGRGSDARTAARKRMLGCITEGFASRIDAAFPSLAEFNDHDDTTFEDVLSVVDCAIEKQH